MNAGLVQRSQAPLVRGGRRVEHPLARRAIVSPYSVTQAYRWIGDAVLPPGEKALLLSIFKLVDSKTWRWPPRTGDGGGSAVELQLASPPELAWALSEHQAMAAAGLAADAEVPLPSPQQYLASSPCRIIAAL